MAEIPLSIDPSKTVQPLRDIADSLDEINHQAEDTGDTFKKSFSKSTDAVDETTHAVMDNTKAQQKNEKQTEDLKKGVVDFGKKNKKAYDDSQVDEYGKSVNKADKETGELAKSTNELGKESEGVFSSLSEGIGDIGGEFGGIGDSLVSGEGGGALGGLTSIIGKLGPIGLAIGAVIGVVTALGTEIIEIDKKFDGLRGTVESLFQATGDEADRIVIQAEGIANTFDQEVNEVLIATNTLAKEFGLSGEEAGNLLASGFNSAANTQGDLIDSVKEFSSQIRASGGDAEDLFAILEKSNKEGIFSDKGIDVVKEFGLRIREQSQGTIDALQGAFGAEFTDNLLKGVDEGSISSIDALRMVSEQMGGLGENSKETQLLIADVFGGAGEDAGFRFLTQLKDINSEEGFRNRQLTESQQRQKENLEANQRLAGAQNELSKAVGDSSAIGRVWTDIQAGFFNVLVKVIRGVEDLIRGFELLRTDPAEGLKLIGQVILDWMLIPLNLAIDSANFLNDALGFDFDIPNINAGRDAIRDYNEEQESSIEISRIAQDAIRKFGSATAVATGKISKYFDQLASGNLTEEKRLELSQKLTEEYGEQIGELDLLTASEEELLEVKNKIIQAEVEQTIASGKAIAIRQINAEIELRQNQLLQEGLNEQTRARLEREIEFLETNSRAKVELVEQETRERLGLEAVTNDFITLEAEELQDDLTDIAGDGANDRAKLQADFDKTIQDILKRGQQAILNDQLVSQEERIIRNRDFQREQLANLKTHAEDLAEELTGSRVLDQSVIDAFNRADEKIITDAQDRIDKILMDRRLKRRQEALAEDQAILNAKQTRFNQELALLSASEAEEIAIIEQGQKRQFETEEGFQRRLELEKLQTSEFFLSERLALIEREQSLKLNAINLELEALADKEGAEVELVRQGLEEKKKLFEQESNAQKEQLNLQLQNTKKGIKDLENTVPTLGEVFGEIQNKIAESLGLDPAQLQAIVGAVKQVATEIFNAIQDSLQEQLEANDEILSKLSERKDEVEEALERELAFAEAGSAQIVSTKRAELAEIEEAEFQANKQREKIVAQQQLLNEISQISSLVTASASLYQSLSVLPFGIGIAIATGLTAAMFGAFIATKAKARNVASLGAGGSGDSTGIIVGNRHSQGGENFGDHIEVEGGEAWSVFSRRGTSKYGELIRQFTEAVNSDNVSAFMTKRGVPELMISNRNKMKNDEVGLQGLVIAQDLRNNGDVLPQIKDMMAKKFSQPDRSYVEKKDGTIVMIEVWPNGSKKKTKLDIRG